MPVLLFFFLVLPTLSLGQNLPNGFKCEDLIDFANGTVSPNRGTSGPVKKPNPKDAYGASLLAYDIELCRRIDRKEITVKEFNVLQAEKVRQLTSEKQKAAVEQKANIKPKHIAPDQPPQLQDLARRESWMLWDIDDRTGKMYPVNSYSSEKECKAYAHPAGIGGYTLRTCFPSDFDPRPRNEVILKHTK